MQCCLVTVSEHQRMCEERLAPLLSPSETLSEDDAMKLGKKDPEQEVTHLTKPLSVFMCVRGGVNNWIVGSC